jgi:glycine/D-amino acid oxidase-like deaminating enzyme
MSHAQIVICGAGIAGIAAAHRLALHHGMKDIVLVDERSPLSLTSDKSTEAYRNWWPGPDDAMARLMERSIDLMEDLAASCANRIRLNRRGYLYVTSDPARVAAYQESARRAETLGIGPVRSHHGRAGDPPFAPAPLDGYDGVPPGADLFLDAPQLHRLFPFLAPSRLRRPLCAALRLAQRPAVGHGDAGTGQSGRRPPSDGPCRIDRKPGRARQQRDGRHRRRDQGDLDANGAERRRPVSRPRGADDGT